MVETAKKIIHSSDTQSMKGKTERALLDTEKYLAALKAFSEGRVEDAKVLLDAARKPMFKWNFIGKFINKHFQKDLQWTFLTGVWTLNPIVDNLVTTRGKRVIAEQINGVSTAPVTAIAIGTGTTSAAAGDTALQTEITTNGGQRGAATTSNQTTTTTGDTARWVKTFSFTGSFAVTEEGLFDNNTSGGNMLARQVFSAVNVVSGDSLQITHNVQLT